MDEFDHKQGLGKLLSRIHRDGGHYIDAHGWQKAVDDADMEILRRDVVAIKHKTMATLAWDCLVLYSLHRECPNNAGWPCYCGYADKYKQLLQLRGLE